LRAGNQEGSEDRVLLLIRLGAASKMLASTTNQITIFFQREYSMKLSKSGF
jgi:hypothetical protein